MAVRGDDVASSIEAHVREAIERMVAEIHASVDDVRAAVDSQLKAALQSVQADVNSITFLPHIKKSIAELEQSLTANAPKGGDASKVKRALQSIERGKSQVDVLNGLLEQAVEFGSRAALLILRGDTSSGWKGVGFTAHGGNDEAIKRFNAAPGVVPQLDTVLRQETVVEWDGASLATRFGAAAPAKALLIPMVIKDKVAATVYVDVLPQDMAKFDRASIEILVFTTGLLVDTLAIRKKIPSPTLSGEGPREFEPMAAPAAAPAANPRPAPRSSPTLSAPRPVPVPTPAPAHTEKTVAFSGVAAASAPAAAPAARPAPARPVPAPAPAPAPQPMTAPALDESRPSTQFVPPSGMQRGGALGSGGSEAARKQDEARRFARLLVSEIKLYNESKVEQGRRSRDLYERLRDDIDRSRQMYQDRYPEDANATLFTAELVRILADGDQGALGT